jgi:hypothetical protein
MYKFVHQATVIYFACIVLLRMMAMPFSLMDYSINRSFISNNYCENRFKSAVHCGGKCYLHKQLAKSNESEESRNQDGVGKNITVDFLESPDNPVFGCKSVSSRHWNQFLIQPIPLQHTGDIFHPPIV